MVPNNSIIGVTTTIEIKPDTANRIQNRIIKQKHQPAIATPNFMLIGISRMPMMMPAISVMITAIEYLANRTIRKQTTRERKTIPR